jgi:glycerophosphoryl diester phosphodiesterase
MESRISKTLTAQLRNWPTSIAVFALMIGAPVQAGQSNMEPRSSATAPTACAGLEVYAHRGAKSEPENSLRAVTTAARDGWPGVELDLQSLADGGWALHHDPILGLKTDVAGVRSIDLSSSDWKRLRLRDRRNAITDESGTLLPEVLASNEAGTLGLNMEIKEPFVSCQRTLTLLDALEDRPAGSWFFTSMDPRHLSCLKSRAPNQYVGLVVVDPNSAAEKFQGPIVEFLKARQGRFTITDVMIDGFSRAVPPPAGVHVDLSVLEADETLPRRLGQRGLHLMVYSKRPGGDVARALARHVDRFGDVLRGVILDDGWQAFCGTLSR